MWTKDVWRIVVRNKEHGSHSFKKIKDSDLGKQTEIHPSRWQRNGNYGESVWKVQCSYNNLEEKNGLYERDVKYNKEIKQNFPCKSIKVETEILKEEPKSRTFLISKKNISCPDRREN